MTALSLWYKEIYFPCSYHTLIFYQKPVTTKMSSSEFIQNKGLKGLKL